jgi:DNA-directed RNA polymerase III subunit RPC3
MIQMHLVFHHTSFDDGVTYYEANMQAAYYLVRSGKILEIIEDNLGVYASRVMSTIMYLGHAQVSYLETLPELVSEQVSTNGINGTLGSHNVNGQSQSMILNGNHAASGSHAKLHQTLTSLAAHGYIVRVREAHFQSSVDTMMSAERIVKAKQDAKQLKGKNLDRFLQDGITDLIQERTEGDLSHGLIRNGVPRGIKRRRVNRLGEESNKRPRLDSSVRLPFEKLDSDEDELTDNELVDEDPPMEVKF